MQKRLLLVLLIIAALLGLFAVYWFVLRPVLPSLPVQPPALNQQPEVPFNAQKAAVPQPQPQQPQGPAPSTTDPAEQERQAQEALKRSSMDIAARVGSYSNADNFDALRVMQASVGTAYAVKLENLRTQLIKDHPEYGPAWGQTLRALSATIDQGSIPVLNRTTATVSVQGQLTVISDGKSTTSYVTVTLTLQRNGSNWMATDASFATLVR